MSLQKVVHVGPHTFYIVGCCGLTTYKNTFIDLKNEIITKNTKYMHFFIYSKILLDGCSVDIPNAYDIRLDCCGPEKNLIRISSCSTSKECVNFYSRIAFPFFHSRTRQLPYDFRFIRNNDFSTHITHVRQGYIFISLYT